MAAPANQQFALAVHLLTLLGGSPGVVLSSELLASSAGASPVHARRVLGRLRAAGIVSSRPGARGGWELVRSPDELTLGEVWRVLNGEERVLGLHGAAPQCAVGQRIQTELEAVERAAARALEAELRATTIAALVARTAAGELIPA